MKIYGIITLVQFYVMFSKTAFLCAEGSDFLLRFLACLLPPNLNTQQPEKGPPKRRVGPFDMNVLQKCRLIENTAITTMQ